VLSKETASLLEEMLPFYDRLAEQAGSEIAPRSRAADATRRVGDIRQRLGQYDRAEAAYLRAIGLYKGLAGEAEGKACLPRMAETWNELSKTYRLQRRLEEARQANQQALAILTAIPSDVVAQPAVRFELARTYYFLGMRLPPDPGLMPPGPLGHGGGHGDGPGGGHGADHGPGHGPDPGEGFGTDKPQHPLPFPISLLYPGPAERGERPEGPPFARQPVHLDTAVTILKDLVQRQPANPEYRHLLALCLRERFSPPGMGRPTTQSGTDEATRILEQLVRDFPQVPDYLFDLCQTYARGEGPGHGPPQDRAVERTGEMEERLGKALAISQQLVAQHANVPEYRVSLAQIHHQFGEVRRRAMREEEAEQSDRKAVEVQAALVAEFPEVLLYKVWLAAYRNSLAEVLLGRGKVEEARALAEQTVAQAGLMLKDNPSTWYLHGLLMDSNRTLAAALRRAGETNLADQAERAAEQHGKELRAHLAGTRPSL
jgi:tetratricopeptide (TPR) repeat protein